MRFPVLGGRLLISMIPAVVVPPARAQANGRAEMNGIPAALRFQPADVFHRIRLGPPAEQPGRQGPARSRLVRALGGGPGVPLRCP